MPLAFALLPCPSLLPFAFTLFPLVSYELRHS